MTNISKLLKILKNVFKMWFVQSSRLIFLYENIITNIYLYLFFLLNHD